MNATPNDVRSFAVGLDENGNSAGARFILTVADELERLQRIEAAARKACEADTYEFQRTWKKLATLLDIKP